MKQRLCGSLVKFYVLLLAWGITFSGAQAAEVRLPAAPPLVCQQVSIAFGNLPFNLIEPIATTQANLKAWQALAEQFKTKKIFATDSLETLSAFSSLVFPLRHEISFPQPQTITVEASLWAAPYNADSTIKAAFSWTDNLEYRKQTLENLSQLTTKARQLIAVGKDFIAPGSALENKPTEQSDPTIHIELAEQSDPTAHIELTEQRKPTAHIELTEQSDPTAHIDQAEQVDQVEPTAQPNLQVEPQANNFANPQTNRRQKANQLALQQANQLELQQVIAQINADNLFLEALKNYKESWSNSRQAVQLLQAVFEQQPKHTLALVALAEAQMLNKNFFEARETLDLVLEQKSFPPKVYYLRGVVSANLHLPTYALQEFNQALAEDTTKSAWWRARGAMKLQLQQPGYCEDFKQACLLGECAAWQDARRQKICLKP